MRSTAATTRRRLPRPRASQPSSNPTRGRPPGWPASSRVIGAFAVEPALERRPWALALAFEALELPGGVLGHRIRRHHHLLTALRGRDQQAAGLLEAVHLVEGLAAGAARGKQ